MDDSPIRARSSHHGKNRVKFGIYIMSADIAPFLIQVCMASRRKCYRSSGNARINRFVDMSWRVLHCSGLKFQRQDVVTSCVHAVV
jgi:hypothetical protein